MGGQTAFKGQARLSDRFACGQQGELGEPVIQDDLLAVEMGGFIIAPDLPADLYLQPVHIANVQRADAASPLGHRRHSAGHVHPKRIDRAHAGDDDTFHAGVTPVP